MRRSIIASTAFVFLLVLLAGVQAGAQRRARKPSQTSAPATATAAASPDPQKPKPKAKLTPLSSSDAGQGSRVTITSTDALNNYSAYRSGDRFYVSIPNADAGAVRDSVRGKGYSDPKVQKRGDEVVLSFKLQPGASARVAQRFNRLDVVFTAPGDSGTTAQTNAAQSNTSTAQRPTNTNNAATTNTPTPANTNAAVTPGTNVAARPSPAATPAPLATNDFPLNGGLTGPMLPPTVTATPLATPSPTATEQIAQAQPPVTTAPITTTTNPATNAPGSSLGVTLLRNWPLALIALLLLAGIGLFITTRRSSASRDALRDAPEPVVVPGKTEKTSAAKLRAATPATATTTAATTGAAIPATPPVTTAPITTPLIIAPPVEKTEPARPSEKAVVTEQKQVADEKAKAADKKAKLADEKIKADLRATKDIAPLVPVDAERVQVETKRLLEGQSYNKMMIGSADMVSRQMVAAELLSALAGRNAERRERARTAFVEHGYFNDTAHDLHFAEAPAERASAARSLGLVGDRTATPHLIAALDDPAMEVRRTTVEALSMLKDPAAIAPLEALREREKKSKVRVPVRQIQHAIDACAATAEEVETPPVVEETQAVETQTVEAPSVEAEQPVEETPTLETQPIEATAKAESLPATTEAEETLASALPATEVPAAPASQVETPTLDEASPDETLPEVASAGATAVEEMTVAEAAVEETTVEESAVEESAVAETTVEASPVSTSEVTEETPAVEMTDEAVAVSPAIEEQAATVEESLTTVDEVSTVGAVDEVQEAATVAPVFEETQAAPVSASDAVEFEPVTAEVEQQAVLATEVETARVESDFETAAPLESVASGEVAIEPVTAPPSSEAAPEAGATRDEAAAGDWIELDMDEAGDALPSSPAGSFTRGFADFDASPAATESTSIDPFEFEKSIDRAPGADVFAPTAAAEEVASENIGFGSVADAPLDEFSPAAPSFAGSVTPLPVEEKGVVPAGEDYSTVPKAIQLRLASDEPEERAVGLKELSRVSTDDAFNEICAGFDDPAQEVRDAAARSLYQIREDRAESFTHALRDAPPERRRKIGAAIASSGLAGEAISHLTGESRDKTYEAFSLLFLMAKAGEVQTLIRAIESHQNNEVRLAVVKLLALSGQADILPAFRRLAVRGSLPPEVRTAVMEAIYQISSTQQPA